jgi:hypothetical protein
MAVDLDDVREIALSLPSPEEHLIRQYVKLRVGTIVYASGSLSVRAARQLGPWTTVGTCPRRRP